MKNKIIRIKFDIFPSCKKKNEITRLFYPPKYHETIRDQISTRDDVIKGRE